MILGFAHPCLVVDDLDAAQAFYSEMFGFRLVSEEQWADSAAVDRAIGSTGAAARGRMLAGHNCFLELFTYKVPVATTGSSADLGPHEPGIRHLAFYVDDCVAEYKRAIALGATSQGLPPEKEGDARAVYIRDPFGNIIELCEVASSEEHPNKLPGFNLHHETT